MRSRWQQTNKVTHTHGCIRHRCQQFLKTFVYLFRFQLVMCSFTWWSIVLIVLLQIRLPFFFSLISTLYFVGGHFSLGCSFHMCDIYFNSHRFFPSVNHKDPSKNHFIAHSAFAVGVSLRNWMKSFFFFVCSFHSLAELVAEYLYVAIHLDKKKRIGFVWKWIAIINSRFVIRTRKVQAAACRGSHNEFEFGSFLMQCNLIIAVIMVPVIRASLLTMNAYSFIMCVAVWREDRRCRFGVIFLNEPEVWWDKTTNRPHGNIQKETSDRE